MNAPQVPRQNPTIVELQAIADARGGSSVLAFELILRDYNAKREAEAKVKQQMKGTT